MKKTTVYLTEDEAAGLRRIAAETGRSQAQLVRDAVTEYVARQPKRKFRSAGIGASARKTSVVHEDERILREEVTREGGWR